MVLYGFPLKFICNVNEMVKHSSVQLVAVMYLLAGLPTANKHQKEEEEVVYPFNHKTLEFSIKQSQNVKILNQR